ncbi:Ada metal-binding domain-containing protein [Mycobacterium sp.]|uniref:Ada metal-binding domain-containing protein n=1 Tax=Mycobacterium sp. TaxID=1785 RepID=UPI002CA00707|nr:Ada metal-binding domain-containing protein [Mycobacterium sp.]HKP44213.1 Ada metal-binding domain-containing protein [Mycobacterium sp.]
MKQYKLIGPDGTPHKSTKPGEFGGHKSTRIYGRLECPSALRAIANGGYVAQRVFFADEFTAIAAGYRPCARCLPERYRDWKRSATAGAERSRCR